MRVIDAARRPIAFNAIATARGLAVCGGSGKSSGSTSAGGALWLAQIPAAHPAAEELSVAVGDLIDDFIAIRTTAYITATA